jgi:hypothetical protein
MSEVPFTAARKPELSPLGLPRRTIAVTARNQSRFARLKVRHPDQERPPYNALLALELLSSTVEDPSSKRDLLIVLAEHRYALHDLITTILSLAGPATRIGPATIAVSVSEAGQQ